MISDSKTTTNSHCLLRDFPNVGQKTLNCSEEMLRIYERAMAATKNGIVIADASQPNLPIIYCNPAFEKITGYSANEVIGKNCRFLQGKDTDPETIEQIRQAIRQGQECCVIVKNYRKDGVQFWNELTISPVHDANGKITHFIGIQNDITKRKEAENSLQKAYEELENRVDERTATLKQMNEKLQMEIAERQKVDTALRESEEKFRAIFNQAIQFVGLLQPDGMILEINQTALDFAGITREVVIGKQFWETKWWTISPETQSELKLAIAAAAAGAFMRYEVDVIGQDNQTVTIDFSLSPICNPQGRVTLLIVEGRDTSERKQAETALKLSQERLKFLLSSNPVVIYSCKAFGDYGPTFISENVHSLFGYTAEEFVEDSGFWANHIHPEDSPHVFADLVHLFEHNYHNHEYRFLHKNGKYRWVYEQTKLIRDHQGTPLEILGYWADISDLKEAEDQLKKSLKEKEVLLKEIHHRVKNNLQVISSLLKLQSVYINDPQTLALFEDSQNRVKAMALIHEKLYQSSDLARIPVSEYIHQLADNLVKSYALKANYIKLNVFVDNLFLDVDTAIPCGLIINELLSNSLKYAFTDGKSGKINIEFKLINQDKLYLKISDDGIGLPDDFQIEETESLGLQLVYNLTEQLGGKLTIDSSNGTSFKIIFQHSISSLY